ncbi:protein translocase subunit SecD [bacterium]|nr:protein translocase subunit SecD [bacterium]
MRRRLWLSLLFLLALFVFAGGIVFPSFGKKWLKKEFPLHLGLDLQGGTHLVYELDLSKIDKKDWGSAEESTLAVIRNRIDKFGVAEPVIQPLSVGGKKAILVELPGIKDIEEAKKLIGQTAQLEFWEPTDEEKYKDNEVLPGFKPTGLTGKHLKKAQPTVNQQTQEWEVSIEFNAEGAKLFRDITKRNLHKPVAIILDKKVISQPTVQEVIEGGKAVITGRFSPQDAKLLAIQLNAGALPVPIKLIEERTVEATLGKEAVKKSLLAGAVGLILVILFLLINYRYFGLWSTVALGGYILLLVATFKLLKITLTLSGIAGLILSVGMAVDANILIFERTKEEIRQGKERFEAILEGFKRAWPSIRDANVSTLLIAWVLYAFGTGQIKGFAVALALGILWSMFSAVFATRVFLLLFVPKAKTKSV